MAAQRLWAVGWRRRLAILLPLVYLAYLAVAIRQNSRGAAVVVGYLVLAAFVLTWLFVAWDGGAKPPSERRFWTLYAILVALQIAELPFARAAGFVMSVFITILTVARFGRRAAPLVIVYALTALFLPVAVTSWHVDLAASFGDVTPVAIPIVGLLTFAAVQVLESNHALAEAQAEVARLAAENERIRIARDLHDLLGHSLTTITVKAGLARRLGAVDPERANEQIAEVESLARQSLSDMRAAVNSYRDVSLTRELATGRELLRAAGIVPDLPRAVDVVAPEHAELFGWVVREGLTNVVRHARASTCSVRLSEASVEIVDDGVGANGAASAGNGLAGLRERVAAAGGVLDVGPVKPKGWRLRVALTPVANT